MASAAQVIAALLSGLGRGLMTYGAQAREERLSKEAAQARFNNAVSLLNLKEALRFQRTMEEIKLRHKLRSRGGGSGGGSSPKISLPVGIEM